MAVIYACNYGHGSVVDTDHTVVEPVALNMRYALAPCVAVSAGGTQMSDEYMNDLCG